MKAILHKKRLGFQWETQDPFLFCAHHEDYYPEGTDTLGPAMPLSRRNLGQDFDLSNKWKMYHGHDVPGFPEHPHRGFETITIVLEGFVDHFDSSGASGRYGQGDVQWMTAGRGMQHAEMFPLIDSNNDNTLHLFQVWLNLPRESKFVEPHYKMLWSEDIPKISEENHEGKKSEVTLIAGIYKNHTAVSPAPNSWAADPINHLDIYLIKMETGGTIHLPTRSKSVNRTLYFYKGESIEVNGEHLEVDHQAYLKPKDITIENIGNEAYILILQAEPIEEPVAQYGPFVMNTQEEIRQAYKDYQKTRFGGWPWDRSDPVHPKDQGRFARYSDGKEDQPNK